MLILKAYAIPAIHSLHGAYSVYDEQRMWAELHQDDTQLCLTL